jgi:hypothetical protein
LPKDFPPFTTVQYYFYGFLYDALRMQPLEVRDGSFALRGTSPYTIRSSSRNSSTKGLASSSHLRFRCRSLGSATAGIFKRSRAICTRPMI